MWNSTFKPKSDKPKTLKQKKCASCREFFPPSRPMQKACSTACALALVDKAKAKEAAKLAQQERREFSKRKEAAKTRSDWMKEAQAAFNGYVRARAIYYGHRCISSGKELSREGLGGGFDAGHFRSVGSAPHLRFNLNNCWGQSKQDNRYGAGAHSEYRKGLIARRGIEVVESLEGDNTTRKFDIEYLKRIKKIFNKKSKRLLKRI